MKLNKQVQATANFCLLLVLAGLEAALQASGQQQESKVDLEEPSEFFRPNSLHAKFNNRVSFDEYVTYALRSVSLVAGFDNDLHRYDNQLDLINSFERNLTYGDELGSLRAHIDSSELALLSEASELTLIENELNQETCAKQLDFIYDETMALFSDYEAFTKSKRLDLIDFIDSFGAAPSEQLLMANSLWLGSFDQCQQARVERRREPNSRQRPELIRGRYCVAHLRLPSWSRANQADKISLGSESIKLGVCLPRACNSISILRHANRIETLIRLARLQQVPYSSLKLTQLYCLPDENSPLRQLSPSARLFIGLVSCWLLLVGYASLKYELARARYQTQAELEADFASRDSKLIQVFAFRYAWRRLFSEAAPSETKRLDTSKQQRDENLIQAAGNHNHLLKPTIVMRTDRANKCEEVPRRETTPKRVPPLPATSAGSNLAAIDGIKVISMIWLISAHTLLFFIRTIANGRQFWTLLLDVRVMTIMAGIFPVDSFFTVTGVLTSYLKFKHRLRPGADANHRKAHNSTMRSPSYWLEIFIHRYLRFMPMYLLVFWYTRDLSEFLGSGPMWDYATASTSLRSICKRESLWVPLLFQANFKPIEQHCVKPAWYLANDYQYLLVTPLFMLLLIGSKWLGYLAIGLSVLASLAMQFLTVFKQTNAAPWWPHWLPMGNSADQPEQFTDFESLINFKPMFATYVLKNLWRLYVLPYNRIPPYLIGLLTGHLMYRHLKRGHKPTSPEHDKAQLALMSPVTDWRAPIQAKKTTAKHSPSSTESLVSSSSSEANSEIERRGASTKSTPLLQYVDLSIWTPVGLLLAVVYLPKVSQLVQEQRGMSAKIGASLLIALMRLVWSLAVARLIFICFKASMEQAASMRAQSHSFVINLLASPKWRPWSKICLSVLLIQWEIIAYLAQIQPVQSLTFSLLLAFVIICIFVSYAVGLLLYLLFEFPLSQIEQLYISPKLFAKSSSK